MSDAVPVYDAQGRHTGWRLTEEGQAVLRGAPERADGLHCPTCQCNKLHPTPPQPENPRSKSWHENALTAPPKS